MWLCHDVPLAPKRPSRIFAPVGRLFLCLVAASSASVQAESIYRCETADGVIFTDIECSDDQAGEVVDLAPDTAGITPGPPEEVREYLAQKREERAEALRREAEWAARQPPPAPAPAPVIVERTLAVPYGWGGYGYRPPRPPIRPGRPGAPRPSPSRPSDGTQVLRPNRSK